MDILNIDDLVTPERVIVLRGQSYSVVDRSVGLLLDSIRAVKQQEKRNKGKIDEEMFFENIIKTVRSIIPECPEEVVRGLQMNQMIAIIEFCNQDPNKMAEEAVAEQKSAGKSGDVNTSKEVEPGKA